MKLQTFQCLKQLQLHSKKTKCNKPPMHGRGDSGDGLMTPITPKGIDYNEAKGIKPPIHGQCR